MLIKKILILTHAFIPDIGGAQAVAYDYANLLVDLGHKVTVLSKEYKNPIQNTKFTYLQVPNKYGEYFWMYNYGTFLKNMDLDGFDLILLTPDGAQRPRHHRPQRKAHAAGGRGRPHRQRPPWTSRHRRQ